MDGSLPCVHWLSSRVLPGSHVRIQIDLKPRNIQKRRRLPSDDRGYSGNGLTPNLEKND